MTTPNAPQASPESLSREEVLATVHTQLESMQTEMDDAQRQNFIRILQNENLDVTSLQNINTLLKKAQKAYARKPQETLRILSAINTLSADGAITNEEIARVMNAGQKPTPEAMQQLSGGIEKVTTFLEGLGKQLSVLGYGTLRMIEGMVGKETFFGKILFTLKNSLESKLSEIKRALEKNNLTTADDTSVGAIGGLVMTQMAALSKEGKLPPEYEFNDHVSALLTEINKTDTTVSFDDFADAGEAIHNRLPVLAPQTTPAEAPQVAAATPERARTVVTGSTDTVVAKNDTTSMKVTREAEGVTFVMNNKTSTLKKVGSSDVVFVELLASTDSLPTSVVVTLADATKVEIVATDLKTNAFDTEKKTVKAKNMNTNADIRLDMPFA
jgi:hypothetical protein